MSDPPAVPVAVYTSLRRSDCDERAFMLAAVGLVSDIGYDGTRFSVEVDPGDAPVARGHLEAYESERRSAARAPAEPHPLPRAHGGAWAGAAFYVSVLIGVALAVSGGAWPADAFERGELTGASVQAGEWWRAWTALTLHWDVAHLAANLGAGVWFGVLAARQLGPGTAWFLTVTGGAAANLFDALLGPASYQSVGASTAVFTALGLMAAHSWRTRFYLPQRRVLRWAPLVAGVILLGWFGSGGEGTDLVAHALGFVFGALLGAAAAVPRAAMLLDRLPQWCPGLAVLGSMVAAWTCALRGA